MATIIAGWADQTDPKSSTYLNSLVQIGTTPEGLKIMRDPMGALQVMDDATVCRPYDIYRVFGAGPTPATPQETSLKTRLFQIGEDAHGGAVYDWQDGKGPVGENGAPWFNQKNGGTWTPIKPWSAWTGAEDGTADTGYDIKLMEAAGWKVMTFDDGSVGWAKPDAPLYANGGTADPIANWYTDPMTGRVIMKDSYTPPSKPTPVGTYADWIGQYTSSNSPMNAPSAVAQPSVTSPPRVEVKGLPPGVTYTATVVITLSTGAEIRITL